MYVPRRPTACRRLTTNQPCTPSRVGRGGEVHRQQGTGRRRSAEATRVGKRRTLQTDVDFSCLTVLSIPKCYTQNDDTGICSRNTDVESVSVLALFIVMLTL